LTIAGNLGISPFEIFNQDTDDVLMLINYYLILGAESKGNPAPALSKSDREESAAFWAAL